MFHTHENFFEKKPFEKNTEKNKTFSDAFGFVVIFFGYEKHFFLKFFSKTKILCYSILGKFPEMIGK